MGGRPRGRRPHQRRRPAPPPAWPSWPVALRHVRSWLFPWTVLWRIWRAWSTAAPPPELQSLLDLVGAGYRLHLYVRC
ncbi:MAG: hypothetical protein HY332_06695 [Chloroflexi bacterium]|nr:hypothetical protein [Chloroflexota bacterium]